MENILIYIKHHLAWVWKLIESFNGFIFGFFYKQKLSTKVGLYLPYTYQDRYVFRLLNYNDLPDLSDFLNSQRHLEYFKPHSFEIETLKYLYKNHSFVMMGVWDKNKIVGYFFLRFFMNKKAFIGRMVSEQYTRLGIGQEMSRILYGVTWDIGFRCFTTISRSNSAIYSLHQKESNSRVLKDLDNDYCLIEILPHKVI